MTAQCVFITAPHRDTRCIALHEPPMHCTVIVEHDDPANVYARNYQRTLFLELFVSVIIFKHPHRGHAKNSEDLPTWLELV